MLSKEIQIYLESQNEKISDVQIKVNEAETNVESGNEQLTTAIEKGKSIRKVFKYFNVIFIKYIYI